MIQRFTGTTAAILFLMAVPSQVALGEESAERLFLSLPRTANDCVAQRTVEIADASDEFEIWATQMAMTLPDPATPDAVLGRISELLRAKQTLDKEMQRVLGFRSKFATMPPGEERREVIRQYLVTTSKLVDLSGRIRYLLRDGIQNAAYFLEMQPAHLTRLIEVLIETKSTIGASVVSYLLFDPAPGDDGKPASHEIKSQVVSLMAAAPDLYQLKDLADFLEEPSTTTSLKIAAAEAIWEIGLPQDPRPGGDKTIPKPAITARALLETLKVIDSRSLTPDMAKRLAVLATGLVERAERGVVGNNLRVNGLDLRVGDWFLMRNPSPYNLFMDLSPGLFTHVGVVAEETGEDGVRRIVIVEMPERKAHIPATNVGAYLGMTLHYVFLRHEDSAVAAKMGEIAHDLIGNETQFDLTFRTERVIKLKGKPLKDRRINTYCAGFLLICAQETGLPRESFFPVPERPAGGNCLTNLSKLGIGIGRDMITPTGALFSQQMEIVGGRVPMYEPSREIKDAVYDHFAHSMIHKTLTPAPNAMQALRERLAALAKYNSLLAKALARANDVSEHMDLESAAKAFTVVGTLDEIADANARNFFVARRSITCGAFEQLAKQGIAQKEIAELKPMRERHQDIYQRWTNRQLSPRALRVELVSYYSRLGRKQLDDRFFVLKKK